jgi:hypothetical protein
MKACRVGRHQGSHIFWTVGSEMALRLLALHSSHALSPRNISVLICVRGRVNPRAIVQLKRPGNWIIEHNQYTVTKNVTLNSPIK